MFLRCGATEDDEDRIRNKEILRRLQTKYHFVEDMMKRKMLYAGHVLRGSSGLFHLQILESYVEGKRKVGAPRRVWMKDIIRLDRSGKIYNGEASCGGESDLEAHS